MLRQLALNVLAASDARAMPLPPPPAPIVNGTDAEECQFHSTVAALGLGQNVYVCSGTLIHPELVLLAAHCLPFGIDGIAFGERAAAGGPAAEVVDVLECVQHPDYDLDTSVGGHDLAYCRLAQPSAVRPVPLLAGCELDALQVGGEVRIVGFGASFITERSPGVGFGVKRSVAQRIHSISTDPVHEVNMVALDPRVPQALCSGDSGGSALLRMADGTWRVFGAGSHLFFPGGVRKPGPDGNVCGMGSSYAFTDDAIGWLEDATGLDVSPCYDGQEFVGGTDCANAPTDLDQAVGEWTDRCAAGGVGGGEQVCAPFPDSEGSDTGTAPSSSGSGGGDDDSSDDDGPGPSSTTGSSGAASDETGGPSETRGPDGCSCATSRGEGYPLSAAPWFLLSWLAGRRRKPLAGVG